MSYWYENAVVYHIYPLGYCGCPKDNDFKQVLKSPLLRVIEHLPVIKKLGFNTIYIGPLFESTRHGYDTADYTKIDSRLGTNEDFAKVCKEMHKLGIRVILDGVFNHVGRDFWAFKDVREKKFSSPYKDWFHVRDGNSNYNDGFFYEGWEGHFELVKLNLFNSAVKNHIFEAISKWREEFGIDGLRLDVAYCLDENFLKELRRHCKGIAEDFWLMGEALHGDYNKWCNPDMLDSVTNYECYKGLYSSFNDLNMYEIAYSLGNRQFGDGGLYKGKNLYCFADNHDVGRIASVLTNPKHLIGLHALLFTMPGVPGVYYGSEYGFKAAKSDGDDALRPEFDIKAYDNDEYNNLELTVAISKFAKAHSALKPLYKGDYRQIVLQNRAYAFSRSCDGETVYTIINACDCETGFWINGSGEYTDVLSGKKFNVGAEIKIAAYGAVVLALGYDVNIKTQPAETQPEETRPVELLKPQPKKSEPKPVKIEKLSKAEQKVSFPPNISVEAADPHLKPVPVTFTAAEKALIEAFRVLTKEKGLTADEILKKK